MTADIEPRLIDLAQEPAFKLASLEVHPATLEVVAGDRREQLEPRVMQVLVALARRRGEVVSRDELNELCWGGRVVGDDAVNRCIGRLRKLTKSYGGFQIETVPRVGFRLIAGKPFASTAGSDVLLVVLPFENLSADPEMTFFSDGVSEEIMQALSRRVGLRVIGRSSSFQFRGADKAVARVASELNVSHILDGAVRRTGERLRLSAQLVDAATHVTLWAEQFDRPLRDIFAVQDEIAQHVAEALNRKLAPRGRPPSIDPESYELYLRARDQTLNMATSRSTVRLLDEVNRRAPEFAAGWALAAQARRWLRDGITSDFSGTGDDEARRLYEGATAAAERASQLAPNEPMVTALRVTLEPICPDWERVEALLLEALAGYPDDMELLCERANFLNNVGRYREACLVREELLRRDPLHAIYVNHLALALETIGRPGEAFDLYREAALRWPNSPLSYFNFVHRSARRGDWEAVDRMLAPERLAAFPTEAPMLKAFLASIRTLRLPDAERRRAISDRLQTAFSQRGRLPFSLIRVAGEMGDLEELFGLLSRCSFEHLREPASRLEPADVGGVFLLFAFADARFRADIRFVHLCGRLGLLDYWATTGHWPDCADEAPYDFRAACREWSANSTAA